MTTQHATLSAPSNILFASILTGLLAFPGCYGMEDAQDWAEAPPVSAESVESEENGESGGSIVVAGGGVADHSDACDEDTSPSLEFPAIDVPSVFDPDSKLAGCDYVLPVDGEATTTAFYQEQTAYGRRQYAVYKFSGPEGDVELWLDLYFDFADGLPFEGFQHELSGVNYQENNLAITLSRCTDCGTEFYAQFGNVEVVSVSKEGGYFVAILEDIYLEETTFSADYRSEPVEDANIYCIPRLVLQAPVTNP